MNKVCGHRQPWRMDGFLLSDSAVLLIIMLPRKSFETAHDGWYHVEEYDDVFPLSLFESTKIQSQQQQPFILSTDDYSTEATMTTIMKISTMTRLLLLLLPLGSLAFQTIPVHKKTATKLNSLQQPYQVSVCTAELCKCQEDGQGADDILQDLLSRDLSYPVDEAPCLGACGMFTF